jgi:hypothetical protein
MFAALSCSAVGGATFAEAEFFITPPAAPVGVVADKAPAARVSEGMIVFGAE